MWQVNWVMRYNYQRGCEMDKDEVMFWVMVGMAGAVIVMLWTGVI